MQCLSAAIVAPTKKRLGRVLPAILISYVASMGIASAATFPVSTEAELNAALLNTGSAGNQQDDVIDLGGSVIELTETIEITNEAGYQLTIQGGTIRPAAGTDSFRLLQITGSGSAGRSLLALDSMVFENGQHDVGAGSASEAGGAAVFSDRIPVQIVNSTFSDNVVRGVSDVAGGAVLVSRSSLSVAGSTFDNNQVIAPGSNASGGAMATLNGSGITVVQSVFSENSASRGGAIAPVNENGVTSIQESTFTENNALGLGGAIWVRSTIQIELSTFFGNNADTGGGALFFQPLVAGSSAGSFLTRNTFVENAGGSGDAISFGGRTLRPAFYANLIISGEGGISANCAETGTSSNEPATPSDSFFASQMFNFSDDSSCGIAEDIEDVSGLFTLGTPDDNGGPTPTIALALGSMAIDAGGAALGVSCTAVTDQRGFDVIGGICDAGAYEFDIVEFDTDVDGIFNDVDNCPVDFNPNQNNVDGDGFGDVCDIDIDGDNQNNDVDLDDDGDSQSDLDELLCGSDPIDATSTSLDTDGDGTPDCAELNIVTVHKGFNFSGNFLSVEVGDVSFGTLRASSVGNDRISSIQIADGFEVVACQDSGFRGRCEVFTDSVTDLRDIGFNNRISSFRVREPSALPVTVFRDTNFGGATFSVGAGDVTFQDLIASSVGNDRISSIQIADGYEVVACQDFRFRGRCEVFTDSALDLRSIGFNDRISTFRVRESSTSPVTVFRDTNFGGESLSVGEGDVTFQELLASSVGNDRISSIQIADGYEVFACQHGGFGGVCETFTGSVFDLREIRINGVNFNNTISSLRVQPQ